MKSLEEYESHTKIGKEDTVQSASRAMMNIVEDISEKGKMTDNQYLEMMNLLLKDLWKSKLCFKSCIMLPLLHSHWQMV